MALVKAIVDQFSYFEASYVSLSGTVTVDEVPAKRQVLIYKNYATSYTHELFSDSVTGEWSVSTVGGSNDKFRVIIVGLEGEFSKIFEDVVGG